MPSLAKPSLVGLQPMLKDCNAMVRECQVQKYDHFPGIQAAKKRIKMTLSAFIDHLHFFGERVSKPEIVYTSDVWGMHILAISNLTLWKLFLINEPYKLV